MMNLHRLVTISALLVCSHKVLMVQAAVSLPLLFKKLKCCSQCKSEDSFTPSAEVPDTLSVTRRKCLVSCCVLNCKGSADAERPSMSGPCEDVAFLRHFKRHAARLDSDGLTLTALPSKSGLWRSKDIHGMEPLTLKAPYSLC